MSKRTSGPLLMAIQLSLILARVTLWLGLFAAFVVGLFTVPIIVLSACLLTYMLWYYVRHSNV